MEKKTSRGTRRSTCLSRSGALKRARPDQSNNDDKREIKEEKEEKKGKEGEEEERRSYEWIGIGIIRDGARYYESLKINDTEYCAGDTVYISGSYNKDFVCQIVCLFENLSTKDKELQVQWFFRPEELSKLLKKPLRDKVPKLEDGEIIFSDQIELMSAECIVDKAHVGCYGDKNMTDENDKIEERLFCRWMVLKNGNIFPYKSNNIEPVKPVLSSPMPTLLTRTKRSCTEMSPSNNPKTPPIKSVCLQRTPKIVLNNSCTYSLPTNHNLRKADTTSTVVSPYVTTPNRPKATPIRPKTTPTQPKTTPTQPKTTPTRLKATPIRSQLSNDVSSNPCPSVESERRTRKRRLSTIMEDVTTPPIDTPKRSRTRMKVNDIHDLIDDESEGEGDESYEGEEGDETYEGDVDQSSVEEDTCSLDSTCNEDLESSSSSSSSHKGRQTKLPLTTYKYKKSSRVIPPKRRGRPPLTTPTSGRRGRPSLTTPTSRRRGRPKLTTPINRRIPSKVPMTTPSRCYLSRVNRKPVIPVRASSTTPLKGKKKTFEVARTRLHVSSIPDSITCREREFTSICTFVESKLFQKVGGCMYISGVPGSGKTATVYEVSRYLQKGVADGDLPKFNFIEINGLKLTEPKQAYVSILKQLTGQKAAPNKAADILEEYFTTRKNSKKQLPVVLLADELDMLYTKKQSVLYNLFDWPTHPDSKLIVLAIANTMDLPERVMLKKVISRVGLTRLTFSPYNFDHLKEIVTSRMVGLKVFEPDAILLAARKVASVTGDARRALDICRRATELAEARKSDNGKGKELVGMMDISAAVEEMFSSPLIMAVKNCSFYEKMLLEAIMAEFKVTGLEETTLKAVTSRLNSLLILQDCDVIAYPEVLSIVTTLGSTRVLLLENKRVDIHRRIRLNLTQDDILFALKRSTEI